MPDCEALSAALGLSELGIHNLRKVLLQIRQIYAAGEDKTAGLALRGSL